MLILSVTCRTLVYLATKCADLPMLYLSVKLSVFVKPNLPKNTESRRKETILQLKYERIMPQAWVTFLYSLNFCNVFKPSMLFKTNIFVLNSIYGKKTEVKF